MQRQYQQTSPTRYGFALAHSAANFGGPGQKGKNVPAVLFLNQQLQRILYSDFERCR